MQVTTSQLQIEIADLRNRLQAQDSETQRANSKFEFSVSEQEKLKADFEAERKTWADEKNALTQRVDNSEAALEKATNEWSGLKRHVTQMFTTIFGKSPCKL